MIVYCKLMQRNGASLKMRIIYSILGCAYYELIDKTKRKDVDLNGLFQFRLCGKLLAIYWKKKYQL